jgi:hypothetical protein
VTHPAPSPTWSPRDPPLLCVAVAAFGPAASALAGSTLQRLGAGQLLTASAGDGWLLVFGAAEDLPWCDGAVYLGNDSGCLVPTSQRCSVPPDLVRASLVEQRPRPADVFVLLPGHALETLMPTARPDADRIRAMAEMP